MTLASRADVTTLLRAWSAGDQAAKEKLRGRLVFTAVVTGTADGVLIISDPIEILFVSGATKATRWRNVSCLLPESGNNTRSFTCNI